MRAFDVDLVLVRRIAFRELDFLFLTMIQEPGERQMQESAKVVSGVAVSTREQIKQYPRDVFENRAALVA